MKKIARYTLLIYLFGIQFILYGLRKPDALFTSLGIINVLVFVLGGILLLCFAHRIHPDTLKSFFAKFPIGIGYIVDRYLFVSSIFLLIGSLLVHFFVTIPYCVFYILGGFFIYTLIIARHNIRNKMIHFGSRLFMPKDVLFWISVVVALSMGHIWSAWDVRYNLTLSTAVGIIFYYTSIKLSGAIGTYAFMRLSTAKFYLFVFIVAAITSLFSFRFAWIQDIFGGAQAIVIQGIQAAKGLFVSSEDAAVLSGDMITHEEVISISTGSVLVQTGNVVTSGTTTQEVLAIKTINFADALTHLIDAYKVPLSSQKNVKFRYVSYTNTLYPVFATAYSKKLIGASTNPVSLVRCDVYQVMKGILAGREINNRGNVLDTYWNYANTHNLLNGCVAQGDTVMTNNL